MKGVFHVDCRIGSLENNGRGSTSSGLVDCRIGSLEMLRRLREVLNLVDCRIGSLENKTAISGRS